MVCIAFSPGDRLEVKFVECILILLPSGKMPCVESEALDQLAHSRASSRSDLRATLSALL